MKVLEHNLYFKYRFELYFSRLDYPLRGSSFAELLPGVTMVGSLKGFHKLLGFVTGDRIGMLEGFL